jgi:hypothetical protein
MGCVWQDLSHASPWTKIFVVVLLFCCLTLLSVKIGNPSSLNEYDISVVLVVMSYSL